MEVYQKAIKEANKKELDGRLDPYPQWKDKGNNLRIDIKHATLN